MTKRCSRLFKVAAAVFRRPKYFFRTCEQEAENLSWAERFSALRCIPEMTLTELVQLSVIPLETVTFRAGGSSVPDYLLLVGLCQRYPACNYFEIGTFLGESLANVAPFCERCVSLSLSEEQYGETEELLPQARQVSRMFSKPLSNVKHLYGDSTQYDFRQISERFDVIFVDGCHDYPSVVSDTQNAVKLLPTTNPSLSSMTQRTRITKSNLNYWSAFMMGYLLIGEATSTPWQTRFAPSRRKDP